VSRQPLAVLRLSALCLAGALFAAGCASQSLPDGDGGPGAALRGRHLTALAELNDGPCEPGQAYVQERLREPVTIGPVDGTIHTELVVRIRERCVPVWVQPPNEPDGTTPPPRWEMQTLQLRTYGFPRRPGTVITEADADDPDSPNIAWSAPGPNFLVHPATAPGAPDGTRFQMRLYNRMPHQGDPHACDPSFKCNTKGPNAGVDPVTGQCKVPPDPAFGGVPEFVPHQVVDGQVIEPPNCFHGDNSTNFHFHGFHISPQLGQDFVGLELRPPVPAGVDHASMPEHGTHGESGVVAYGHFDFAVDPLRYTQPPGTHWFHAHKHGSTALQVLNGLVGTFEVRGEFDEELESFFARYGGGPLVDRLMVVQQLQQDQPGLGGADQNASVLINGQANPIVTMKRGEVQRWRFVGATMQASASLRVGFPEVEGRESPQVRQIAMDGVQFSPENYGCQPFLNNPDCSLVPDESEFDELTAFALAPGNRVDLLVKAPDEAGTHCMVYDIVTVLHETANEEIRGAQAERAQVSAGTCGIDPNTGLGPLFTLVVERGSQPMDFPTEEQFPPMASFLADIPPVDDPALQRDIHYEMVNQGNLNGTQFWIEQAKFDPACANETVQLDRAEQWTLWNNSGNVAHPFHIHQNPFQLVAQSDRTPSEYTYPVWRDTMPIPKAAKTVAPNSDPVTSAWGNARIRYVAKEFTGLFVNHCHILGHEDRGMMQNVQAVCPGGRWGTTGPVPPGAECDEEGFCPGDCIDGEPIAATPQCPEPPAQTSDWPVKFGVPAS
jgi:L-ascorbate oxidase